MLVACSRGSRPPARAMAFCAAPRTLGLAECTRMRRDTIMLSCAVDQRSMLSETVADAWSLASSLPASVDVRNSGRRTRWPADTGSE